MKKKGLYKKAVDGIFDAWKDIRRHPHKETIGVDGESIESFSSNAIRNIKQIRAELRTGSFHFQQLRPHIIKENGKKDREILIFTVRDRVVSRSILEVIKPKFAKYYSGSDYSIKRHKKNARSSRYNGVPLIAELIQRSLRDGFYWVFETDIKSFFDSIPKEDILKIISHEINDKALFSLIQEIVNFQVKREKNVSINNDKDIEGIAQGSSISPLLASLYLYKFDIAISNIPDVRLIRYVDDLIILCKTRGVADKVYIFVQEELAKLGLSIYKLNETSPSGKIKTRILNSRDSREGHFIFLGLSFNYCDIDIPQGKKVEFVEEVKSLLFEHHGNFLEKKKRVENKFAGFTSQYSHPHYRTRDSLFSLRRKVDSLLEDYFIANIRDILGYSFFKKLTKGQIKRLLLFFGG